MKTKKFLLVIFTVAFCTATALFLTGCGNTTSKKQYDYLVTFDYNVEGLGDTNVKTQYLGVNKNSKIVAPGYFGSELFAKGVIANYFSDGWYTAKLDEKGNILKDENGRVQVDKKWDFDNDIVTSDITLYANFRKNITLTIIVKDGENKVFSGAPGDVFNGPIKGFDDPIKKGFTFIDYYTDETYTAKFTFPYTYTEEDATCYAKFIEGEWTLVGTALDFRNKLVANITQNIYITAKELDFTNVNFVDYSGTYFGHDLKAKIYGNGCVFKNMTIQTTYKGLNSKNGYALFGTIGANAEIKDIKFENLQVLIETNSLSLATHTMALFATEIEEGAKMENVSFESCTLKGSGPVRIGMHTYCVTNKAGISDTIFDKNQLTVIDGFTTSSGTETQS